MRAVAGGVEEAQGAVEVQAAEAGGVVALAAAEGAGGVVEGGVDEGVGRRAGAARGRRGPRGGRRGGGRGVVTRWPAAASAGGDEAADGAAGAGEQDVHQRAGGRLPRSGSGGAVVEGPPERDQRREAVALGVGRVPGLLVLEVEDADRASSPRARAG